MNRRITRWGGRSCGADRARRPDGLHCSWVSTEAVNRRRVMDQPATPARYLACNREAPRCGGGDLGRHEGPQCGGARRLTCGSLTGDSKRGRAAAPLPVALRYPLSWGGAGRQPVTPWVSANRTPWPQRRTDAQSTGRPTGRPFFFPQERLGAVRLHLPARLPRES